MHELGRHGGPPAPTSRRSPASAGSPVARATGRQATTGTSSAEASEVGPPTVKLPRRCSWDPAPAIPGHRASRRPQPCVRARRPWLEFFCAPWTLQLCRDRAGDDRDVRATRLRRGTDGAMGKADRRQDKARALAKADERRRVALRVFQGCDQAGAHVRGELASKGITPSCTEGCSYCCHYGRP